MSDTGFSIIYTTFLFTFGEFFSTPVYFYIFTLKMAPPDPSIGGFAPVVVVVNNCFTSLFGTKGLLSDFIIR